MPPQTAAHLVGDVGVDLGHREELLDAGDVAFLCGAEQGRDHEVLILPSWEGGGHRQRWGGLDGEERLYSYLSDCDEWYDGERGMDGDSGRDGGEEEPGRGERERKQEKTDV